MAYTDEGQIEKFLMQDIDSSMSSQIASWINAVKAWIDNYTGNTFEATSESRYFDGSGTKSLFIDPLISVSEVLTLDIEGNTEDTLVEGTDFRLYPLNETIKTEIRLMPVASIGIFASGSYRVKVTGIFGFSSVPAPITLVATKLVANIINEGLKDGKLKSVSLGNYSATFKDIDEKAEALGIYNILDQYKVFNL